MSGYMKYNVLHKNITEAAKPAIMLHLASAFFQEGDDLDAHVQAASSVTADYIRFHIGKIPKTEYEFSTWEGRYELLQAITLDTMMNVQEELLGGDDSRFDYVPDGIAQIAAINDDNGDGNGFVWWVLNNYAEMDDGVEAAEYTLNDYAAEKWGVSFQDCTSEILASVAFAFRANRL